ncbi:MAG TPA: hypothetical protein VEB20_23110 [Azospirillaceae bacterium]|nr:hypothetical protein [Azospirillaceae bacterium]
MRPAQRPLKTRTLKTRTLALAAALLLPAAFAVPGLAQQAPAQKPAAQQPAKAGAQGNLQNQDAARRTPKGGDPNEAERKGLTSPEVQRSQDPQPTPQGTRPPNAQTSTNANPEALYAALQKVRAAPPGLDGKPIPRPNPLGSEPTTEMQPHPDGHPKSLFPEGYVE